jgi:hypothetical protein
MARLDTVSPVTTGGHYNKQLDAAGARSKWWSRQAVEGKLPLTLTLTEPQTLTLCEPCVTRMSPVPFTLTPSLTRAIPLTLNPIPYIP